ncbi:toxin-activating lysine-acyltransferase [Aestuariispira insulae]|uniref:RTX toxin-activating lysine-acyltransferase n=1 Tax=Aestuariispira insulae TaxID=1461337 RepID=A0A3D9H5C8_9PROT|nr:toxin-activating lysine-acyltransferase [Aestuariispira insulae]RED44697.1 hemolysin-activating ACP:hemolysin acyltransferase [Aestuariispira insulae]
MTKGKARANGAGKTRTKKSAAGTAEGAFSEKMKQQTDALGQMDAAADKVESLSDEFREQGEEELRKIGDAANEHLKYLGEVAWLMTQLPTHKHLFITDLEWLIIPPLSLGQARIWREKGLPVAYASWAFVNDSTADRIAQAGARISPAEWNNGKQAWLMDVITPFGGADKVVKELREEIFKGQSVKTLVPAPDGSGMKIVEL